MPHPSQPLSSPRPFRTRFWLYWYPLALFQEVRGSSWERAAAWRHNVGLRPLLLDTALRWWTLGVWLLALGDRLQHGQPGLAKMPLCAGAVLLAMSATPIAGFLLLGQGHG